MPIHYKGTIGLNGETVNEQDVIVALSDVLEGAQDPPEGCRDVLCPSLIGTVTVPNLGGLYEPGQSSQPRLEHVAAARDDQSLWHPRVERGEGVAVVVAGSAVARHGMALVPSVPL